MRFKLGDRVRLNFDEHEIDSYRHEGPCFVEGMDYLIGRDLEIIEVDSDNEWYGVPKENPDYEGDCWYVDDDWVVRGYETPEEKLARLMEEELNG